MASSDLSILVVDDAKFSSAVIAKTLRGAGYRDVRIANSANQALDMINERPVSLLIADWLMPEMDGLQLAGNIRQIDEAKNHFTYIMLLTAKEGTKVLVNAFDKGVDDFINKSSMNEQLLPRIYAAGRIANMQNRLLNENKLLLEANRKLKKYTTIDPLTGLGNRQYAENRLKETIRHCENRGGVPCYALITLHHYDQLKKKHSKRILSQLIVGVSRRIRQLVRPVDVVARFSQNQFALVTCRDDLNQVGEATFRRIFDGVNLKAYKTTSGYVSVNASVSICGADVQQGTLPSAEELLQQSQELTEQANHHGELLVAHWQPEGITKLPPVALN